MDAMPWLSNDPYTFLPFPLKFHLPKISGLCPTLGYFIKEKNKHFHLTLLFETKKFQFTLLIKEACGMASLLIQDKCFKEVHVNSKVYKIINSFFI